MKSKLVLLLVVAFGLSGCIDPKNYESEPVEVSTPEGIVTCQLYTKERVLWDRAINRPETMSVEAADAYCLQEGQRQAAS